MKTNKSGSVIGRNLGIWFFAIGACFIFSGENFPSSLDKKSSLTHSRSDFYQNKFSVPDAHKGLSAIQKGKWKGEIQGQINNQRFRSRITVIVDDPFPGENNPVHLAIVSDNQAAIGAVFLMSANQVITPQTTRKLTLQYFTVKFQSGQIRAVLTNDHKAEAAVINSFVTPNISAQTAPDGPAQRLYATLGTTEIFAFKPGTLALLNFSGSELSGSIKGKGYSVSGIFPTGDVIYQGILTASRVQ